MKKIRVGLMFGGTSNEHAVSIESARAVFRHLDRKKYSVVPIAIHRSGKWLTGPASQRLLTVDRPDATRALATIAPGEPFSRLDVVLPLFHGRYGEDGTLQGLLEMAGVPYVGSGVLASALGMDKMKSRMIFRDAGLPVPPTAFLDRPSLKDAQRAVRSIGLPCVVKPNRSGSSIGVSIVHQSRDVSRAWKLARRFDYQILVEKYLRGRELTVAVLGSLKSKAMPVTEIVPTGEFFDLAAKYRGVASGLTKEICPASIPPTLARTAQALAVQAHMLLNCRGLTRTDMIASRTGKITLLEINTIPGFTENSLAPKAVQASGITFSDFLDRLIQDALTHRS